ncbi:glutathione peroxidase [Paenibacillus crassostreae]|uniref:Glutathione peroxidase n=1 Tax=Paenibacillus crassostreae TaxID=1763538 RepID=A0A167GLK3_9BACL|nr:glutathione peroxidase [Paenibacillus crassostreae]AOZ92228.1 glutathione peroxidase [Paenibacillus crassostreae]OAB77690.1 glutathione peroxidase [Paenibacillus crassostreae]
MSIYDIEVTRADGAKYLINEYKGKPMLIVNTATKCGLRNQFDGLEMLHKKYKDEGLIVLGFPSDQFGQELRNGEEAEQSCRLSYGVTFPMHDMVKVNGKEAHPLFDYLTSNSKGFLLKSIKWNFTKFLIDRDGNVVGRYSPTDSPESIEQDIQQVCEE